jgi:pimeloyl-ACP methyl ester carboxylesterase
VILVDEQESAGLVATRVLRSGSLSFSADELGEGPLVLCLHGFPDHRGTFIHQLHALAAAGYRVIVPDLRGYEPSSQPKDEDYHIVRMAEDVLAWIDDLGCGRAHLLGHDWGAAVAYATGVLAPDRIRSITTLAVPPLRRLGTLIRKRPDTVKNLWYMGVFQLPFVAERLLLRDNGKMLRRFWHRWSPGHPWPQEMLDGVVQVFQRPGVAHAALGYYRALPDVITEAGRMSWRLLTSIQPVPTLMLTGAKDGCMDSSLYDLAVQRDDFATYYEVERLQGVGHFLHLEAPEQVNSLVLRWLNEHP